jgi:hypothetical protein
MPILHPNHSLIPNDILDNLREFSNHELRFLLALCRFSTGLSIQILADMHDLILEEAKKVCDILESRQLIEKDGERPGAYILKISCEVKNVT